MNRVADKVALASGMALVVLSGSSVAEAGIVASQGLPLRPPATDGQVGWDVDGDGSADFGLLNGATGRTVHSPPTYTYGNTFPYFITYPAAFLSRGPGFEIVGSFSLGKLPAGAVVGPDAFFGVPSTQMLTVSGQIAVGGWQMGETGFFGFKFGSGLYGWAELAFDPTSANTAGYGYQILRAYYDDTGAPITVGNTGTDGSPVPEPSSYALALLAAGGVAAYRSRRKTVAA
jgi:hypothetical protein